jgi:hypothetical protein
MSTFEKILTMVIVIGVFTLMETAMMFGHAQQIAEIKMGCAK